MTSIGKLFAESPFGPLAGHTEKVHECVSRIRDLFEALLAEDHARLKVLHDEISGLEHEADRFKNDVREQMPRTIFLPVDRSTLIRFLKEQDSIADTAEDVAVLLIMRKTTVHADLKADLMAYVLKVIETSEKLVEASRSFQRALEKKFQGSEADRVVDLCKDISRMEWETDQMRRALSIKTFAIEDQLDPVTIFFYTKLFVALGKIADHAENTADNLRLMVRKK